MDSTGSQGEQGPAGGILAVIALIVAITVAVALGTGGIHIISTTVGPIIA